MINGLDLFSGIGGLSIALKDWVRPIAYCEIDPYCQGVLLSRMEEDKLPKAPIWDDIRTFAISETNKQVDIIYGGFPCQDISITGLGKGLAGQRSSLCYDIFKLANEINPRWIFLENVPAITTRGGIEVVKQITKMGYDCRWITITAASLGALHKRERWFLLAHAQGERFKKTGQPIRSQEEFAKPSNKIKYDAWDKEPENKFTLAGVVNGLQDRAHRIKALGNAVVPVQAKEAFKILMGLK